ncbi:hypothetical protein AOLI_G00009350 [Acnodon oligacanthus]
MKEEEVAAVTVKMNSAVNRSGNKTDLFTWLSSSTLLEMSGIPPDSWQPATVSLETTMGTIVLELYWKHAPKTCKNFAELGRRGYYNNTKFHRIIKDFMVQGGDPTGTGRGGASIYGKQFEDELHPELKFTGAGILAMANTGPDTNGSQFFLTLAPTQWLDGKHSIFGRVYQGIGVLNRIGMVETNSQDRPVDDIKILRVTLPN